MVWPSAAVENLSGSRPHLQMIIVAVTSERYLTRGILNFLRRHQTMPNIQFIDAQPPAVNKRYQAHNRPRPVCNCVFLPERQTSVSKFGESPYHFTNILIAFRKGSPNAFRGFQTVTFKLSDKCIQTATQRRLRAAPAEQHTGESLIHHLPKVQTARADLQNFV